MNDPIAILKKDHREAEALFKRLKETKSPSARRRSTLDKLEAALRLHMQIEEKVLYPAVTKLLGEEPVTEADIEHTLGRDGLAKMRQLVDRPGFGAACEMTLAGIKHHVKEEETEMFPKFKKRVSREDLVALGDEIEAMKKAATKQPRRMKAA